MKQKKPASRYGRGVYRIPQAAPVQLNPFKVCLTFQGVRIHGGVYNSPHAARLVRQGMEIFRDKMISEGLLPPVSRGGRPKKI